MRTSHLMLPLILPLVLNLAACESQPTEASPPTMVPADELGFEYNPLYPNAPFCEDVGQVNGAFLVRLHSWYSHVPLSLTIAPNSTDSQRRLQAEVYSYYGSGQICRNMTGPITWAVIDAPSPPLVTGRDPFYSHVRIEAFRHIPFSGDDGSDKAIATVSPKQSCCPINTLPGGAADSVTIIMSGF